MIGTSKDPFHCFWWLECSSPDVALPVFCGVDVIKSVRMDFCDIERTSESQRRREGSPMDILGLACMRFCGGKMEGVASLIIKRFGAV